MLYLGLHQSLEHRLDSAEIMVGNSDADAECRYQHQGVFQHADPRYSANAAGQYESCHDDKCDRDGQRTTYGVEAGDLDDEAQTGKLQLQVRNNEEEADDCNQGCQILVPVALLEEVGLGVEREFASCLPDSGQNKERDNVGQRKAVSYTHLRAHETVL